jgi:AAA+ ATPase superfamily predicted ATPase
MKSKITNPFITAGYISPEYFCDREEETKKILNAVSSGRNLTLISLRRVGKTGLLKHIKFNLEHQKKPIAVIYIDLLPSSDANDFLNTFSTALIRIRRDEKNFLEKILTILVSLRPQLTYDSLTGQPALELKVNSSSDIQTGLETLLQYISKIKQDIVIMFDEFQQIAQYPEKNIEHILRTIIQTYPQIPFIFSGSSKHMLEKMFLSAGRPFYQSSELMYLDNLREESYSGFILSAFGRFGKTIDSDALSEVFKWTRVHTYYVQYVCSLLFENDVKIINTELVHQTFYQVLMNFEPLFVSYRNLIPGHQFRLLQAIASENEVTQPTSGSFINKYNLTSASSITTSLKALTEKEMIINTGNSWIVYDVFFSRWLEYNSRLAE